MEPIKLVEKPKEPGMSYCFEQVKIQVPENLLDFGPKTWEWQEQQIQRMFTAIEAHIDADGRDHRLFIAYAGNYFKDGFLVIDPCAGQQYKNVAEYERKNKKRRQA